METESQGSGPAGFSPPCHQQDPEGRGSAADFLSGIPGRGFVQYFCCLQMEVITKTPEDMTGVRYVIEGGREKSLEEIGAPNGTTMLVRNLFFNTPARAKFLKTAMTEAGYVSAYMEQLALSHQDISFKYMVNGQMRLHSSGNSNLKDVIYGIYGRDITRELLEVRFERLGILIEGFIGKPVVSRGNRNLKIIISTAGM